MPVTTDQFEIRGWFGLDPFGSKNWNTLIPIPEMIQMAMYAENNRQPQDSGVPYLWTTQFIFLRMCDMEGTWSCHTTSLFNICKLCEESVLPPPFGRVCVWEMSCFEMHKSAHNNSNIHQPKVQHQASWAHGWKKKTQQKQKHKLHPLSHFEGYLRYSSHFHLVMFIIPGSLAPKRMVE